MILMIQLLIASIAFTLRSYNIHAFLYLPKLPKNRIQFGNTGSHDKLSPRGEGGFRTFISKTPEDKLNLRQRIKTPSRNSTSSSLFSCLDTQSIITDDFFLQDTNDKADHKSKTICEIETDRDKSLIEIFDGVDLLMQANEYDFLHQDLEVMRSFSPFLLDGIIHEKSDKKQAKPNIDIHQIGPDLDHSTNEKIDVRKSTLISSAPELNELWVARTMLISAAAMYGTNFSMVKIINDNIPVGISTTLRFALAAFVTLPWLIAPANEDTKLGLLKESEIEISDKSLGFRNSSSSIFNSPGATVGKIGFEIGIWCSLGYVAQAVGLQTVDASKSAFICSLTVVIVPILDHFCSDKKLRRTQCLGILTALTGVALLEFGGNIDALKNGLTQDEIASLIQPFAFGMGFWKMEQAMRRFPSEAMKLTATQLFAIFVFSVVYCFGTAEGNPFADMNQVMSWLANPMLFGALFWSGVVTTALTVCMETLAMKTLSAAETTMLFSTEPIFGTLFAAAVIGEHVGIETVVGAALILTACFFSNEEQNEIREENMEVGLISNRVLKRNSFGSSNFYTSNEGNHAHISTKNEIEQI